MVKINYVHANHRGRDGVTKDSTTLRDPTNLVFEIELEDARYEIQIFSSTGMVYVARFTEDGFVDRAAMTANEVTEAITRQFKWPTT